MRPSCLLFVLVASLSLGGCNETKSDYDKVKEGMSIDKVISILGQPDDQETEKYETTDAFGDSGDGATTTYSWFRGEKVIFVLAVDGEVYKKSKQKR